MHPVSISSLSTEYVRVEVEAYEAGALVDPTSNAVAFAFETDFTTEPSVWQAGEWETDAAGPTYYARILIGPGVGGHLLADGKYFVWIKVTSTPELPIRQIGVLTIT